MKIGSDNNRYLRMRSEHIRERISKFGGKLYLESDGKFFDDYHASHVPLGPQPDSKFRTLLQLTNQAGIVIAISAADIKKNKIRGGLSITYGVDVLRLIQTFRDAGLYVGSVVITRYIDATDQFKNKLEVMGVKVYRHYSIDSYPTNIPLIASEDDCDKNEYIEITRPLIIMAAPGSGSGRVATCLSQLYHENRRGVKAGYAKFETFPIWNLPLSHPVSLTYEAVTADLNDVSMIDPFHLETYGKTTVDYNRDVEIFSAFSAMFEGICGSYPYRSPTDMGVNMTGNYIADDGMYREVGRQRIIRRWYTTMNRSVKGESQKPEVIKIEFLMKQTGMITANRPVVHAALLKTEMTDVPVVTVELPDGHIVTGKIFELFGTSTVVLLNAVKTLGGIPDEIKLISPIVIEPVQALKINYLGSKSPCLHTGEILVALSMNAASDPNTTKTLEQLKKLRGCQAYTPVMLSEVNVRTLDKPGLQLTSESRYENKKIYH